MDIDSSCAITSLVQSPAIDVVGIGFASGELSIYDIRADERLMRIFMDGGEIRSLAFRSGMYTTVPMFSCDVLSNLIYQTESLFWRVHLPVAISLCGI